VPYLFLLPHVCFISSPTRSSTGCHKADQAVAEELRALQRVPARCLFPSLDFLWRLRPQRALAAVAQQFSTLRLHVSGARCAVMLLFLWMARGYKYGADAAAADAAIAAAKVDSPHGVEDCAFGRAAGHQHAAAQVTHAPLHSAPARVPAFCSLLHLREALYLLH
jgi:hypothetical protein